MLKRLRQSVFPALVALLAPVALLVAVAQGASDNVLIALGIGSSLVTGAYVWGAWSLQREEARGVAMVAAEHAKGNAGPPPELLDALGQLGEMVGLDVEDLIAGDVPGAPPQPRYPAPWEPTSEAAPHVFRGTPSSPDVHREGRLLSGRQGPLPPGVNPAKEIPPT